MSVMVTASAAADVAATDAEVRPRVLIVSVAHPDALPPLYAVAQVLADHGIAVDAFTFTSPAPAARDGSGTMRVHECGDGAGAPWRRAAARRRLGNEASRWATKHDPAAVLATCPVSLSEALRIAAGRVPVVYLAFETYDAPARAFLAAPASTMRNRRILGRLREVALICAPSPERSGWLAARANLAALPATVLNVPARSATRRFVPAIDSDTAAHLPAGLPARPLVVHTGRVSATQAVLELVESVEHWPAGAALVVTNLRDDAYARRVRAAAEASPRRADIVLLGAIPRHTMLSIQRMGRVGVCLLRAGDSPEAMMPAPNKVGEYLHAGLCLAGLRMAYLDRLEADEAAVLCESLEPRSIGRAVTDALRVAGEPAFRERIAGLADGWYSMEVQARPIVELVSRAGRGGAS